MENTSRKRNLSFCFNVDLDNVDADSDSTTDSETTGLQIDVAELENSDNNGKKKRESLDETTFVKKTEEELERQLDEKAAKTNLTATNVKNIIKHVISHELVRAMVQKSPTMDDIIFEPKLTRSKAKELGLSQPEILGHMTPIKNATPEVQVLIEGEFSENSSDEEYEPDKDLGSDIDSQPSTPATPGDPSVSLEDPNSPEVQYDEDGVFKVPLSIPHVPTEKESIGHRTRSKLSLKETPLEVIEQAFVPPDITSDMYDYDWEPDEDWVQFLQSCYQKEETAPQKVNVIEDDPEDPEYNILEDKGLDFLDKEELRQDKAVKITKKELKNLIAELGEHGDRSVREEETRQQQQLQQQRSAKKKKTPDSSFASPTNTSRNGNPMVDLIPVLAEPELPELVSSTQHHLLSVQMSQHVQLLAQQFVMTYKHPKFHNVSKVCKDSLNSLSTLGNGKDSKFLAQNLSEALKLVSDWESKLNEEELLNEYIEGLKIEEGFENKIIKSQKRKYIPKFHPELIKLMINSKALMFPHLLPPVFPCSRTLTHLNYLPSEEGLIAIGLEQFFPYHEDIQKKFQRKCDILADAAKDIQKYLLPIRNATGLLHFIQKRKWGKKTNAIKQYFDTGLAPRIKQNLSNAYELIPPIEQPPEVLPEIWNKYIHCLNKDKLERAVKFARYNSRNYKKNKSAPPEIPDDISSLTCAEDVIPSEDHELRNPIVNMLKYSPSLKTPEKSESSNSSPPRTSSDEKISNKAPVTPEAESENEAEPSIPPTPKVASKKGSSDPVPKRSCAKTRTTQLKTNEIESDAESAESQRAGETDEEESRPTRLRMTTPRLAKIKSAQNMKLLAQALSSKASTSACNSEENKEDNKNDNSEDSASVGKGDNEDEIAELMLASTTIKKNTTSRKKTKQAREHENLKRLIEAQNNIDEVERATKFASSFIQKVHEKLESNDPELFKEVLKAFLDFEEMQNTNRDKSNSLGDSQSISKRSESNENDLLAVQFYKDICEKLRGYPDLCSEFVLFLKPHQALMAGKAVDHLMSTKISDFFHTVQNYFAKQPSRLAKIVQAVTQMASEPQMTEEKLLNTANSILKGHPLIIDLFLQLFPSLKPPESLFAPHLFENIVCPSGPHDKLKEYDEDAPELYENIELPASSIQEDPYGGDSCKCDCHAGNDETKPKGPTEHCAACGTRFLNGRMYLQTLEGLRPAKITFPGAEEEKLENISRVSLKTIKRIPSPPPRKRRKGSKRDSICEDAPDGTKTAPTKVSPVKDNEDKTKSKRTSKSPLKSATKAQNVLTKSKREKKSDKKDAKIETKTDDDHNDPVNADPKEFEEVDCKMGEISTDSHEDDVMTSPEKVNFPGTEKTDVSSDSDSSTVPEVNRNSSTESENSWTMQDDKILLEHIQENYSERTFIKVSALLKRPIEQVKERVDYFLSVIEKMS